MLTLVLQREHVNSLENMATAEYRRGHGTLIWRKLIGPGMACRADRLSEIWRLPVRRGGFRCRFI